MPNPGGTLQKKLPAISIAAIALLAMSACSSSTEPSVTTVTAEASTVTAAPPSTETPEPVAVETETPTPTPEPEPEPEIAVGPKAQQDFAAAVAKGASDYNDAGNELKETKAIANRDKKLCSVTGGKFEKWVGTVHDMGTNGDGDAYLAVVLEGDIELSTWNNALSDIVDETLIPSGSKVWDAVADLSEGDTVTVSGEFVADGSNCVKTGNMTKTFAASSPDFKVKFKAVKAG